MMRRLGSALADAWHIVRENGPIRTIRFAACRLARIDQSLPLRVNGVALTLRTLKPDLSVARHCLIHGEFSVARKIANSGSVSFIIDAGGYIGTAAIAFAKMFPHATIVTIEPSSENFTILKQNVAQFGNIIPLRAALVGGADRSVTLYDRDTGSWGYTLLPRQGSKELRVLDVVPGISLPSLMSKHEVSHIDILKLDIEGSELDVLQKSAEWMPKVRVIFAELHDRIVPGCTDAFEKATSGMKRIDLKDEKHVAVQPTLVNSFG